MLTGIAILEAYPVCGIPSGLMKFSVIGEQFVKLIAFGVFSIQEIFGTLHRNDLLIFWVRFVHMLLVRPCLLSKEPHFPF
jgi:hypothetical protein